MRLPLRPPTAPLPGPRWPPDEGEDSEWLLISLCLAIRAHMCDPDPDVARLVSQWAAEAAMLQEIRRGLNDPG